MVACVPTVPRGCRRCRHSPPWDTAGPCPAEPAPHYTARLLQHQAARPRDECRSGKHNLVSKPTANLRALKGHRQPAAHIPDQRPERATTCNRAVPFCWPPHGSIPTHSSQRTWHCGSCNACSSVVAHRSLPAAQGSGDALRSCRRCSN